MKFLAISQPSEAPATSTSPTGEEYPLPVEADYQAKNNRLSALVCVRLCESVVNPKVQVHDPYVKHWWELEKQDTYPAPGHSWSRFFRNQESLSDLRISKDLKASLKGVDAVILAVRYVAYQELEPEQIIAMVGNPAVIIDCFAMLSDTQIKTFFAAGYEVKGLGRGHMKRLKEEVVVEK